MSLEQYPSREPARPSSRLWPDNPNQADLASERILLTVPQAFTNRKGGLAFGQNAAGEMYVADRGAEACSDSSPNKQTGGVRFAGVVFRLPVTLAIDLQDDHLLPQFPRSRLVFLPSFRHASAD
jgi:hypothetical protein